MNNTLHNVKLLRAPVHYVKRSTYQASSNLNNEKLRFFFYLDVKDMIRTANIDSEHYARRKDMFRNEVFRATS